MAIWTRSTWGAPVGDGVGESGDVGHRAVPLAVVGRDDDVARPFALPRCQWRTSQPSGDSAAGVTGAEEVRVAFEEVERVVGGPRVGGVEALAEVVDPVVDGQLGVVAGVGLAAVTSHGQPDSTSALMRSRVVRMPLRLVLPRAQPMRVQ